MALFFGYMLNKAPTAKVPGSWTIFMTVALHDGIGPTMFALKNKLQGRLWEKNWILVINVILTLYRFLQFEPYSFEFEFIRVASFMHS